MFKHNHPQSVFGGGFFLNDLTRKCSFGVTCGKLLVRFLLASSHV